MRFLFEVVLPEAEVEWLQVEKAANFFQVIGDKLYVVGKHDVLHEVPPTYPRVGACMGFQFIEYLIT